MGRTNASIAGIGVGDLQYTKCFHAIDHLLEVAKADAAFADLYLQRARELLSTQLTEAQYEAVGEVDREVASLMNRIRTAVEQRDFRKVSELTHKATDLGRIRSDRTAILSVAERVYGFGELLVDPFSPGINGLAGVPEVQLPALRHDAVGRLEALRAADPAWADLYDARKEALRGARFAFSAAIEDASRRAALEARVESALTTSDLARLQQLSTQLLAEETRTATADDPGPPLPLPVLDRPFSRDVRDRAGKLGLAPYRVESMFEELRARFRPSWQVAPGDPGGNTVRFSVTVPGDTEEALRENLTLFVNRAFVTSAGTRYIPWCVAEDLLLEDFEEGAPASAAPSPLGAALGLPGRTGLTRGQLEKALRERGATVVRDLGLDPREYRIVCLPADVYTRLGSTLGWGRQELWTHFDGYMASAGRKLMPLAGGDVRFGGLHDLVAVGADYGSDRLLARFAVVQRRRFATW